MNFYDYIKYDNKDWNMGPKVRLLFEEWKNIQTIQEQVELKLKLMAAKKNKIIQEFVMKRRVELKLMNYKDYLKTPEWQEKRHDALISAGGTCQRCGKYKDLQVHHLTYERRGEELPEDLMVLCQDCHMKEHGFGKERT